MKSRLRGGAGFIVGIMFILLVALTYRQAFSDGIADHPGNRRALIEEMSVDRGDIYAADGEVLATSRRQDGAYRRVYPKGEAYAAATGYYSAIRGRSGVEAGQNAWLTGRLHFSSWQDWYNSLANRHRRGFDITLSIRPELQNKAWDLLAGRRGAIVVLNPASGAVLAIVGRPTYDPNLIESNWEDIAATEGLLVNRASQGLYPPGSIFKIITAAGAISSGKAKPDSIYNGPAVLPVFGGKVTNFADQDEGRMTLARAFTKSTNTIFAQVGLDIGAAGLVGAAQDFGFNSRPPFDLPAAASVIPQPASMDKVMTAWTAVGQGRTLVTPLQMALTAGAIGEEGRIYRPWLTEFVRDYEGAVRYQAGPRLWRQATDSATAAKIKKMMVATVKDGTGRAAWLSSVAVAGKTGTAEVGGGSPPHAWFIGFAPADDPQVAVAVLVENGGLGGRTAAPIAREIFKAALKVND